ncbi:hypothetical protein [Phenylobacterium sp.]|uniref:hypothetical protein n=1 Tax=Phenylobacterium sp. TaxID=1871053 RepID=UPI002E31ADE0|nr:hypothetical protein [Phenylobacterium sp.]HEX3367003.1 hypothetical protein [Phenylobacterium sp.]
MPDPESEPPSPLSRRTLLAAPVGMSASMGAVAAVAAADECVPLCMLWLANDAELNWLFGRYNDVEGDLFRDFRWSKLTPDERKALPEAAPLNAIQARLDHLLDQRRALASKLRHSRASTRQGVMLKFEVVNRELHIQDFPAIYGLLRSAVRDLALLW